MLLRIALHCQSNSFRFIPVNLGSFWFNPLYIESFLIAENLVKKNLSPIFFGTGIYTHPLHSE